MLPVMHEDPGMREPTVPLEQAATERAAEPLAPAVEPFREARALMEGEPSAAAEAPMDVRAPMEAEAPIAEADEPRAAEQSAAEQSAEGEQTAAEAEPPEEGEQSLNGEQPLNSELTAPSSSEDEGWATGEDEESSLPVLGEADAIANTSLPWEAEEAPAAAGGWEAIDEPVRAAPEAPKAGRAAMRTLIGGLEAMDGPKLPPPSDTRAQFFGRRHEMETLLHALEAVRREGESRSVIITGPPGIGKSRLVDEFLHTAEQLDDPAVRVYCAAVPSDPDAGVWACFSQLFSQRFELDESLSIEEAKDRLRTHVSDVLNDRKVGDVLYFLGELLDLEFPKSPLIKAIDDASPEMEALKRAVIKGYIEADAAFGPMCFVVDDLHAVREPSLALLRSLVENVRGPVLMVGAARPELLAHADLWEASERHAYVRLEPLGEVEAAALIGSLMTPGGFSPMYLVEQVRDATGGNPSRIEEAARIYRDDGTLPSAAKAEEASTEARIDQLASADRSLLQKAALVGGVFWTGALVALERFEAPEPTAWDRAADASRDAIAARLSALVEGGYLLRLPDSAFPSEEEYIFKHRPERERLLDLVSRADAGRWHAALAEWLSAQPTLREHEEYLEMLAAHRLKSGATELAAVTFLQAADTARAHGAVKKELAHREKALKLLPSGWLLRRLETLQRMGELFETQLKLDEALACHREALTLSYRLDQRGSGTRAQLGLSRVLLKLGRRDEVPPLLGAVRELLDGQPPGPAVASARAAVDSLAAMLAAPPSSVASPPSVPSVPASIPSARASIPSMPAAIAPIAVPLSSPMVTAPNAALATTTSPSAAAAAPVSTPGIAVPAANEVTTTPTPNPVTAVAATATPAPNPVSAVAAPVLDPLPAPSPSSPAIAAPASSPAIAVPTPSAAEP